MSDDTARVPIEFWQARAYDAMQCALASQSASWRALLAAFLGFVGYVRYGLTVEAAIAGSAAPVAPAGQRPFEILTDTNFSDLREVFNAHAAEPRIAALLSPS